LQLERTFHHYCCREVKLVINSM